MKNLFKVFAGFTVISLALSLAACGGSGSGPAPTPPTPSTTGSIAASIANSTLQVPSSQVGHQVKTNPTSTTLTFTASALTGPVTVSVTDQKTSGNTLDLSATQCKLLSSTSTCQITVTAVSSDVAGSSDTLTFQSSESGVTIAPTSVAVTFEAPPAKETEITATTVTKQLSVPSSAKTKNLKADPISTTLTFTGTNLTGDTTVGIGDAHTSNNSLKLSKTSCPLSIANPTCSITVTATPNDTPGGTDELDFSGAVVPITPSQITYQFTKSAPTQPTISITPNPVSIVNQGTQGMRIEGESFGVDDQVDIKLTIGVDSQVGKHIASYSDGSYQYTCTLSKVNNYQCNASLNGLMLGSHTNITAYVSDKPGTTIEPDVPSSIPLEVVSQPVVNASYTLDATNVGGPTDGSKAVAHITGIGEVDYDESSDFSIDSSGNLQVKSGTPSGVYQINVKATTTAANAITDTAYNTFYVLISPSLSLQSWKDNTATQPYNFSYNVDTIDSQPLTMIYSYSHFVPYSEGGKKAEEVDRFFADYGEYGQDINNINTNYLKANNKAPINALAAEFAGPEYQSLKEGVVAPNYWTITDSADTDIRQQVTDSASGVIQNGFGSVDWIKQRTLAGGGTSPGLVSTIQAASPDLSLSPDLTFGNSVSADYPTYDPEQLKAMVGNIIKYADGDTGTTPMPGVVGLNLDLEKGTSNTNAAAIKEVADHLAYQGLYFGYYEFADKAFQPSIINAMGPLGIAYVSAYDVGDNRASETDYNTAAPDVTGGFGTQLYNNIFSQSKSCGDGLASAGVYSRASWCNLSSNDSEAANKIAWTNSDSADNIGGSHLSGDTLSTKQAMNEFNGNFSIVLPVGESSTDFTYLELFNPDLAALMPSQAGLVATDDSKSSTCGVLSNKADPSVWTDANIKACLLNSTPFTVSSTQYNFVNFNHCYSYDQATKKKTELPYNECILISANISGNNDGSGFTGASADNASTIQVGHPSQADYMRDSLKAYDPTNPHLVGYSLFALQNAASGPGDSYTSIIGDTTSINHSVQEPWSIGPTEFVKDGDGKIIANCTQPADSKTPSECDPFYSSLTAGVNGLDPDYIVNHTWDEFATLDLASSAASNKK